jgi:TPR repeat protein
MKYYQLSADKGNSSALHNIGLLYEFGRGIPINKSKAEEYYALARQNGYKS